MAKSNILLQSAQNKSVKMTLALASIGRTDEVARLFDSLLAQKNTAFEVILADQNQDDRLVPLVLNVISKGMNITHVRLDKPNQYLARTVGIEKAKGRYIAFPDDDCWYELEAIANAIRIFETSEVDVLVGRWREASGEKVLKEGILLWEEARNFRIDGASMITQFYKTEAVRAIGGFDKRMGLGSWFGGGEDTDILFSALRKKMKVLISPRVVVRHRFELSTADNLDCKRARSRSRGTGALYAKHKVPLLVIFRGFLAPAVRSIFCLHFKLLSTGLMVSLGRVEGYFKWKFGKINTIIIPNNDK